MARASRSKTAAFDPNELNDLIFSPAVGSGVGSHLLAKTEAPIDPRANTSSEFLHLTTVATSRIAPVSQLGSAAVISKSPVELAPAPSDMTTVATSDTEAPIGKPPVTNLSTVATHSLSTVDSMAVPTVDTFKDSRFVPAGESRPAAANDKWREAFAITSVDTATLVMSTPEATSENPAANASNVSTVDTQPLPTVDITDLPTVATLSSSPESAQSGRDGFLPPTTANSEMSTVDTSSMRGRIFSSRVKLWITEQGDLIPEGRVKRIRLAQDVINSAEESVYDTLWTAKGQGGEDREMSRIVQAGYDYLAKRTRLARKTIQRIVAKLIDKDFIRIERPADIYQRTSTVYRVFSYRAVLDHHTQRGRTHVAKVGPGFSYVQPFDDPRSSQPLDVSTVVDSESSTVDNEHTVTVAAMDLSTVVRKTTSSIGSDLLEKTTSAINMALTAYGVVDDAARSRLVQNCRAQALDCTEQEIVQFIHEKGRLIKVRGSNIQNPIGFLIDAVPKCFAGESFRAQRAATATVDQGREVTPVSRTDELQQTCWLLRELPKSVNAGRWRETLAAAQDDETVSEDLRALILRVLAGTV